MGLIDIQYQSFIILIFGSSRKVVGFKPSKRQSKITNKGKEILIVSIAKSDTLGDLDFVVEALQLAGADWEHGMGGKAIQARSFQLCELHEGRDAAGFGCIKPALPALIGSERISSLFSLRMKACSRFLNLYHSYNAILHDSTHLQT